MLRCPQVLVPRNTQGQAASARALSVAGPLLFHLSENGRAAVKTILITRHFADVCTGREMKEAAQ